MYAQSLQISVRYIVPRSTIFDRDDRVGTLICLGDVGLINLMILDQIGS